MAKNPRALALVAPHCDIVERLELIPPSASTRGVYFKNVEAQVEKAGRLDEYRDLFGNESFSSFRWYPMSEYLPRLACAGALIESPERLHDGMFQVSKNHVTILSESLIGRALFRMLAKDPVRLTEQGIATRRQTHSYGRWELFRHDARTIEVTYESEYQWIESVVAGAAYGTYVACGVDAKLTTRLRDRFNGSTIITW